MSNLWKIVRFCYDMPKENRDPTIIAICNVLEKLATLREGVSVNADLASGQDKAVRILAINALRGKKYALSELNKMTFQNDNPT
ncbi:MAG: hypothetical protein M1130_07325 [Actinobacteria bacterium]|nr:hypothetical protein [Actinomycetota bacterium]